MLLVGGERTRMVAVVVVVPGEAKGLRLLDDFGGDDSGENKILLFSLFAFLSNCPDEAAGSGETLPQKFISSTSGP